MYVYIYSYIYIHTHPRHSKIIQKYVSNSDIKWSQELGKYKNASYKINLTKDEPQNWSQTF